MSHTCAVQVDGRVQCWSDNVFYKPGNETRPESLGPVTVSGITNAVAVAARCAVLADGRVQCWNRVPAGKLDGTTTQSSVPVTVSGITNAVAVAGSCAVLADGRVQCWTDESSVPVPVTGITNAVAVAGEYGSYCAVLADGRVQCWGGKSLVPVTVTGITNAVAVSRGSHTCAVLADGRVQCWGRNGQGELGNGTRTDSLLPVTVSGITNAVAVAASTCNWSCAVLADGRVQCWGHKLHFDAPREGTKAPSFFPVAESTVPETISGITNAVAVAAQDLHPCAVLADGRVQCWGFLAPSVHGNGTTWKSSVPVTVSGLAKAVRVAGGTAP
jgi:hypothetical protein